MQVVVIGMRWIEVLAELLLAWRERQRERRSLIVREKSDSLSSSRELGARRPRSRPRWRVLLAVAS